MLKYQPAGRVLITLSVFSELSVGLLHQLLVKVVEEGVSLTRQVRHMKARYVHIWREVRVLAHGQKVDSPPLTRHSVLLDHVHMCDTSHE